MASGTEVAGPTSDAPGTGSSHRWVSLAGICTAAGIVWLAFSDFSVAIPTIADDLDADLDALQWAYNGFSLAAGALVIASGRFADVYGRRRILLTGIALFGMFSVVAALAHDEAALIVGRALLGVSAALILPATLALIPVQFSGPQQVTAFGAWQAVAWGGQAVGPAVGGVITDGLGWEWLFWCNLPLCLGAFLVVRATTPESDDPSASHHVDVPGLLTIALAVFCLLFALIDGPALGWGDPLIVGLFAAAVVLAVAWVLVERHVRDPLVDLQLFTSRPYDGAITANLTMNLTFAGLSFLLVLWLQRVRDYDAIEAGLLLLPATLGIFLFIPLGDRLNLARGARLPVLVGLTILGAGLLLFGLISADSSLWLLAGALLVVGIGLGLMSTPISSTAVGGVVPRLAGTAAGVFKMSSMVGGALGAALLTAIARGLGTRDARDAARAAGLSDTQIENAERALVASDSFEDAIRSLPPESRRAVTDSARSIFSAGVSDAIVTGGVMALVVMVVLVLLWPHQAPAGRAHPPEPETGSGRAHPPEPETGRTAGAST